MEHDEEEFYDSLEEDQNSDNIDQNPSTDNEIFPKEVTSHSTLNESECSSKKPSTKSIKIPLYAGEIDKEDIKINKTIKPVNIRTSIPCISCEPSSKFKFKTNNDVPKKKQHTTYWNIYCQKNGIPTKDEEDPNETIKSLYGSMTNKTFNSFISSCCLSGSCWDAPSVFEKYMPKKYANPKNDVFIWNKTNNETGSDITRLSSAETDIDNLKSVSQIQIIKAPASSTSKINITKTRSDTSNISALRPLILKNLTPNKSKMDLLKRQQEYGIRASNKNRAKIIQNLSKLRQELKECEKNKSAQ